MYELANSVKMLEEEQDQADIVKILQEIGEKLINAYEIRIGAITLEPLWVEAYYFDPKEFPDYNTHMSQKQKNRFGQLYFHEKGWGGIDICLSKGDYYLSFLLKATLLSKEGNSVDKAFKKQIGTSRSILELSGLPRNILESEQDIFARKKRNHEIMHAKRIHLAKPCFREEELAVFALDTASKYRFVDFARESLQDCAAKYIQQFRAQNPQSTKEECQKECRKMFGWLPNTVNDILKDIR